MRVRLEYGRVIPFEELPDDAIALDGYVAGPALDPARRRFSFDHHGGGVPRLVLLATCQQVLLALELGLAPGPATQVFVNDADADTVLAVWLLQNAERQPWRDPAIAGATAAIGLVDAHGPLRPLHPLHEALEPPRARRSDAERLETGLRLIGDWARDGSLPPPAPREEPARSFGFREGAGWSELVCRDFAELYGAGFAAGVRWTALPDGTHAYGLAKKSDLVVLPLGPASLVRPPGSDADYLETLLGRLARAERRKNPAQSHAGNWGGGTSVGGGPRNPDGSGSRLLPDEVLAVLTGA